MNANTVLTSPITDILVPRGNCLAQAQAWLSLSHTQRRLAHRYRRETFEWEARGNHANYAACMAEGRRLWRSAKWHLQQARQDYERAYR